MGIRKIILVSVFFLGVSFNSFALTPGAIRSDEGFSELNGGIETVDAAGTAQVLASSTKCKRVSVKAELDNTGNIFVGGSDVDKTTKNGIILDAGEAWIFYVDNLAKIYIDASVTGDGVHYTYEN